MTSLPKSSFNIEMDIIGNHFYIVKKIFESVREDIDRLSFLFTCKRLYQYYDDLYNFKSLEDVSTIVKDLASNHPRALKSFSMSPVMCILLFPKVEYMERIKEIEPHHKKLHIWGYYHDYLDVPHWIESLRLHFHEKPLTTEVLPPTPTLRKLHLGYHYKYRIEPNTFPESLTSINLGDNYDSLIGEGVFIKLINLRKLDLGNNLIQVFPPNFLPTNLTKLKLSMNSDQMPTLDWLPPNLEYLRVSGLYEKKFFDFQSMTLPITLKQLHFTKLSKFNSDLNLATLINLTHLSLPMNYHHKVQLSPLSTSTSSSKELSRTLNAFRLNQLKCGPKYLNIYYNTGSFNAASIILYTFEHEAKIRRFNERFIIVLHKNLPKLYIFSLKDILSKKWLSFDVYIKKNAESCGIRRNLKYY